MQCSLCAAYNNGWHTEGAYVIVCQDILYLFDCFWNTYMSGYLPCRLCYLFGSCFILIHIWAEAVLLYSCIQLCFRNINIASVYNLDSHCCPIEKSDRQYKLPDRVSNI